MSQLPPKQGRQAAQPSLDEVLDEFEEAWNGATPPVLESFWKRKSFAALTPADRSRLIIELVKIDLHHRCLLAARRCVALPLLEGYVARLPELGSLRQLPADLIAEEYSARHAAGARPEHAEYHRRFPDQAAALQRLWFALDDELRDERPQLTDAALPAPATVAALVRYLVELGLLTPQQADEPELRRLADNEALFRFLTPRGWLTPYQLEQLARGRPHALTVGPYLLLERIGEGATSVVFRARHRQLERVVALKVIRKELVNDVGPEVIERIYREFRAVGRLAHPNFVHAYDAGPVGATLFIAMEYLEGANLLQIVTRQGPLPVDQACDYVRQACVALHHATANGIVHRDVKPSNLVVVGAPAGKTPSRSADARHPWGLVKLLDLGMARLHHLNQTHSMSGMLTHKGAVMGTADYISPEQAADAHSADTRADLYSLGCTLFFLIAGRPPFVGGGFVQKVERHRAETPISLRKLRPEVASQVAAVVARLLAKDPDDRYQTPAELYAALGGDPDTLPVLPAQPPLDTYADSTLEMDGRSLTRRPSAPPRAFAFPRRWSAAALIGGTALLLFLAFQLGGTKSHPPRTKRPAAGTTTPPAIETRVKVLAVECGRKEGQILFKTPPFECKLVQGALWDSWPVEPPAKSYCWFHSDEVIFEISTPPGTAGDLRLCFFDGDSNQRRQRLIIQGRPWGEIRDFGDAERVVEVPLSAADNVSGVIEVRIEKLQASNAVVSTIEFYTRKSAAP